VLSSQQCQCATVLLCDNVVSCDSVRPSTTFTSSPHDDRRHSVWTCRQRGVLHLRFTVIYV